MDFEYQLFDTKIATFIDDEAPATNDNEDEQSEGMQTYNCTYPGCKKNFRYRSEIMRHTVTHTNKRPYVCSFKNCMKGFKRSDALATHMRIHTREKTFECPYAACKSTFSTKAGLKYHTLKHKTEKRLNNNGQELKVFSVIDQENLKYETNEHDFSNDDVMEFGEEPVLETPYENLNFIKHYSHASNYSFTGFDAARFDNTHLQQIAPMNFCDNAVHSEKMESDTYLTNYSTLSNPTNNSAEVDGYLNYHFTNAPQNVANCAANLINFTEDTSSGIKAKSLMSKSSDRIIDMMQKIIEENSNLKKKLDLYQRLITGPQYVGEEQNNFF